ncbi:MAG TPA: hypothetical protein DEQ02_02195 [Ruminococcaceae bacterium]|nr:hypothetical protein [Oscillospiraceae bacterium]
MLKKILGVIICIMAVFSAVIITSSAVKPPHSDIRIPEAPKESIIKTVTPVYILKDYEGKLAVFPFESDTPEQILDVFISSLPEYDQRQLQKGVLVYSSEQLDSLIQDYDG